MDYVISEKSGVVCTECGNSKLEVIKLKSVRKEFRWLCTSCHTVFIKEAFRFLICEYTTDLYRNKRLNEVNIIL